MVEIGYKATAVFMALLFQSAAAADAPAADEFFFKPNDRIVFLGDSITAQYQYSTYIELYLTTRFPEWNLTFINTGINGDTAPGGAGRFANDVLAEKPTCVTINYGMNDVGNPEGNLKPFVEKTGAMLADAKAAGVRVALLSPNSVERRLDWDLVKKRWVDQIAFYAPLKDVAAQHGAAFVDQFAVTRAVMERLEAEKADTVKPFPDGIHTGPAGGLLMAHTILVGLHAPSLVSHVLIDGNQAKTQNCTCEKVQRTDQGVTFTRLDNALPIPIQKDWLPILPYVDNLKNLNWYGLQVAKLTPGTYSVKIDGVEVGQFSADELAAGVNLGNVMTGPVFEQGQKALQLIHAKNKVVQDRFGVVMHSFPAWAADVGNARKAEELKKRMDQIQVLQSGIYQSLKPVSHNVEVLRNNIPNPPK